MEAESFKTLETSWNAVVGSPMTPPFCAAYVKAQSAMKPAIKDSLNPHLKNKYADLASVIDAVKDALNANGLGFLQVVNVVRDGDRDYAECTTKIIHETGCCVSQSTRVPLKPGANAQETGSGFTYAKRYGLQSLFGIPSEDDDGNAVSGKASSSNVNQNAAAGGINNGRTAVQAWLESVSKTDAKGLAGISEKLGRTKLSDTDKAVIAAAIEARSGKAV